jgi:hypothetical protein
VWGEAKFGRRRVVPPTRCLRHPVRCLTSGLNRIVSRELIVRYVTFAVGTDLDLGNLRALDVDVRNLPVGFFAFDLRRVQCVCFTQI